MEEDSEYYLFNNWIDVEGIDYGWLWLKCKDENRDIYTELKREIDLKVRMLVGNNLENKQILCYLNKDNGDEITTVYVSRTKIEEDVYYSNPESEDRFYIDRKDLVIRFSDRELVY